MDDDNQIQWSYISKLLDKIDEQAERLHWDGLIDNAAEVFDSANRETDAAKVFFEPYQYLFRLYYRVKHFDKPREWNEIYKATHTISHEEKPFFRIINYTYSTFLWARRNGFVDFLDNNVIDIPEDKLSPSQVKQFNSKVKN